MSRRSTCPACGCSIVEEQQTRHRFCEGCGRHDPPNERCPDRPSALWAMLRDPAWPGVVEGVLAAVRDGRDP